MRKLLATVATAFVLIAGSALVPAEAATPGSVGGFPLTKSAPPVENVGCWCGPYRCACRRYWGPRRYYWGPRRYYRWRY